MNIFNKLKYPISNPPTAEQLDAIPLRLFEAWLELTLELTTLYSPRAFGNWMNNDTMNDDLTDKVEKLRRAVLYIEHEVHNQGYERENFQRVLR
jgi:hypothetical protein